MKQTVIPTLEQQRMSFAKRRLLATPLSGMIVWTIIGISGFLFSEWQTVLITFIGTGSIVYLALFLSKFTGENFLDRTKPKNEFDKLFLITTGMSFLVYAIAIPFFMQDHTSITLSIGILTGILWLPISWILNHWIGFFHTISRTVLIVAAWYLFPTMRFTLIPFIIVFIYLITILVLEKRYKEVNLSSPVQQ